MKPRLEISQYFVKPMMTVHQVIETIDRNKDGIVLVVDEAGKMVGTVTDGDIRRFLLAKRSLDEPCSQVMWTKPIVGQTNAPKEALLALMQRHRLRNLPLVDPDGKPKRVLNWSDLFEESSPRSVRTAVVMAGGEGKRLWPLTESMPKPMVTVGDKPILENIVGNLVKAGITEIFLSVNYQADVIEKHFGDGSAFGAKISYLREKGKLGTAGSLSLLPQIPSEPLIVMNGDVLTSVPFDRLLDFHHTHRSVMTIASIQYHFQIPYGVLNLAGSYVIGMEEKPSKKFLCNAGIYVLNPEAVDLVPVGKPFNMTELGEELIRHGLPVSAFPMHEHWIDIGQKEDLAKARAYYEENPHA